MMMMIMIITMAMMTIITSRNNVTTVHWCRYLKESEDAGVEYQRHTGPTTGGNKFKREPEGLLNSRQGS
jgi:hypothetical protein